MSTDYTRYLRRYTVIFILASAVIYVMARSDLFPWIGPCNAQGYSEDHYLAYCEYGRYGDFEHGALLYSMEPGVVDQVKKSDVLFLGNSRAQYAFSTQASIAAMDASGTSWYAMGFGFGARSDMPEAMIKKHRLKPKLVVINADPFFSKSAAGLSGKVLAGGDAFIAEYEKKRKLQDIHPGLCERFGQGPWSKFTCGDKPTLFRARSNGTWVVKYYRPDQHIPVVYSDSHLMDKLDDTVAAAEQFFANTGIDRSCVVLTTTPQNPTPVNMTRELAKQLDVAFIFPELEDLWTIDASHLDVPSAERWSAEFMRQLAPHVERCAL
ncbi:MAG: hypothetical protein ACPGSC_15505 [Granulosicoccaceae bacterium]